MAKRYLGLGIIGVVVVAVVFMFSLNVMAAGGDSIIFKTDKSTRTIVKEVLVNQRQTHALLREIKALLREKK